MSLDNLSSAELGLRSIAISKSILVIERQSLNFATRIEECRLMRKLFASRGGCRLRCGTRVRARRAHGFRKSKFESVTRF